MYNVKIPPIFLIHRNTSNYHILLQNASMIMVFGKAVDLAHVFIDNFSKTENLIVLTKAVKTKVVIFQ